MGGQNDSTWTGKADSSEFDDNLDWTSYSSVIEEEKEQGFQKFKTLFIKNPFVPIGVLVTGAALFSGIRSMVKKDSMQKQYNLMRLRVYGQGFTIAALVAGYYYHNKSM